MKLFLLSLLVVGAFAKDLTKTKDKSSIHDLLFKDDTAFNFGELSKLKIHQRLSTLVVDPTQQHFLDDISLNVDRCINSFNDDYKTNQDVQKYRYSVGNLVGIIYGQIDFVERNNLFNDAGYINDLIDRLKQCDVVIRDTDVINSYRGIGWLDYWNRDTTGGVGVDNFNLNFVKTNKAVDNTNVYRGGAGVYRDTDGVYRGGFSDDYASTYRGGVGRGDVYGGYRVGDKTGRFGLGYNTNDGSYGRFQRSLGLDSNKDNDQGVVGWYRVIYGIVNDDDTDYNSKGTNYLGNYAFVKGKDTSAKYGGGVSRFGKNVGGDYYSRFGTGKDTFYNGPFWNRFGSKNVYGDNTGYNYDRFDYGKGGYQDIYNRYDTDKGWYGRFGGKNVDAYGRKDFNWNGDYYNTDAYGRNYYDTKYGSGARDYRFGRFRQNSKAFIGTNDYHYRQPGELGDSDGSRRSSNSDRSLYFGIRHNYDRDTLDE